ncbi:hypothetical protein HY620_02375 [Candidatus Uhrbacteria bacterium]|nr:hypothetical protein [Candidatus Uhrbacteria bacterium]
MRKFLAILTIVSFLSSPASVYAQLAVRPEFNPGLLIPDSVFVDTQTFGGPEGIQTFLESKNSILAQTSPDFLVKLNEPYDSALKSALGDPQPSLPRLRTAAELIWDASRQANINPQVILVTLNKEQGLITSTTFRDLQKALDRAMGFACPDSTGCGNLFPGFYYQLFGNVDSQGNRYLGAAKSLAKSFTASEGRGPTQNGKSARVGDTIVVENTLGGYANILAAQAVTLLNKATAALYRYTPHVFNGNYNFWKFFTDWFKYPNGTLVRLLNDPTVYIIQNGNRQQLPLFVAESRKINFANAVTVSPSEMREYPLGSVYGPEDNTVVNVGGKLFVFAKNIKHPVTEFVLSQRKIDSSRPLPISESDATLFSLGPQLSPLDGTVLRGEKAPDVYLVKNGVLQKFSPFTFRQYGVAKQLVRVPDDQVDQYEKKGYVVPRDGTLVKSPSSGETIYAIRQELRRPLTPELFKNYAYKKKDIVTLRDDELASIDLGTPPPPKENTYFSIGKTNELYLYKDGAKHPISKFVAKQRGITPDYSFEASIVANWPNGIVIPPLDGTLVRAQHNPAVSVVKNGQLRMLTRELFKNLGYTFRDVVVLPDEEVAQLPTDGFAEPKERTFFSVTQTRDLYLFSKGELHAISPLVAKQRRITPDYTFTADVIVGWKHGSAIPPLNGTLIKGDTEPTIYLIANGKKRLVTADVFKKRRYAFKNVQTVPQAEIARYPDGELVK